MEFKILHITPHLGGGVGTVLLNWLTFDKTNKHAIATLDYANEKAIDICETNNIELYSQIDTNLLLNKIINYDIVLIHFWNHPLLYDFLVRNELPQSRIIFWSHVSGIEPPNLIIDKVLEYSDRFVFTTPASFNYINSEYKLKCSFIVSTGGVENFKDLQITNHSSFNIGYIGTVDYSKMHPKYTEVHKTIKGANFVIVGGDSEKEIQKEADDRFTFTGKVGDVKPYLQMFDIFGYLLNPKHFGTAEQVLQEAMAAGVVPVVLNNPSESHIVKHNETGFVADTIDEYLYYINLLKDDVDLRNKMSINARAYALKKFSLSELVMEWNKIFEDVMQTKKSSRKWDIQKSDITAFDVFLESLGDYKENFIIKTKSDMDNLNKILQSSNWKSKTKGTHLQYLQFFPNDKYLIEWSNLLK